jgi:hypothetical protein
LTPVYERYSEIAFTTMTKPMAHSAASFRRTFTLLRRQFGKNGGA